MPAPSEVLQEVRRVIKWDGVQAGLRYLNSLSAHRYTGLFLFDGDKLKNTFIYDRSVSDNELFPTIPAHSSYCLLVKEGGKPLTVVNALQDQRLTAHSAREVVQSYCGAPLRDHNGEIFGTVCNFSLVPCDGDAELMTTLSAFAAVLLDCERLQEIGWRSKNAG